MLIDERNKIEAIYLEVINTKLLLENSKTVVHDVAPYEITNESKKLVELKKYLKTLGLTSKEHFLNSSLVKLLAIASVSIF